MIKKKLNNKVKDSLYKKYMLKYLIYMRLRYEYIMYIYNGSYVF